MTWVETRAGYVNLATARCARQDSAGDWIVYDAHDNGHRLFNEDELCRAQWSIFPASGTQELIAIYTDEGKEFIVERHVIIGWRMHPDNYAEPIIPGMQVSSFGEKWMAFIKMPDGHFLDAAYESIRYESISDAQDAIVKRIRRMAEIRDQLHIEEAKRSLEISGQDSL